MFLLDAHIISTERENLRGEAFPLIFFPFCKGEE